MRAKISGKVLGIAAVIVLIFAIKYSVPPTLPDSALAATAVCAGSQAQLVQPTPPASRLSEDSCGPWERQSNGCYFRLCVDSNGKTYCEECCGKRCSRVDCK